MAEKYASLTSARVQKHLSLFDGSSASHAFALQKARGKSNDRDWVCERVFGSVVQNGHTGLHRRTMAQRWPRCLLQCRCRGGK